MSHSTVDRRGHGNSGATWTGNDMHHYGDDLAAVTPIMPKTPAHPSGMTMTSASVINNDLLAFIAAP